MIEYTNGEMLCIFKRDGSELGTRREIAFENNTIIYSFVSLGALSCQRFFLMIPISTTTAHNLTNMLLPSQDLPRTEKTTLRMITSVLEVGT